MPRMILVALATLFIFCGCQSAPTFGQSAVAAPQAKADGLIDTVVQGVSSLLGAGASSASVPVDQAPKAAPLATAAQAEDIAAVLKAMDGRLSQANKRAGQARNIGFALAGLVVLSVILVALVALGYVGRVAPYSANEKAVVRELRAIRRRQATLATAIGQLQEFVVQSTEDRDHFKGLLGTVGDELKKLDGEMAAAQSRIS